MAGSVEKIAVLCSGTSLLAYPGDLAYDQVIAVNRAILRERADYWICLDPHTFGWVWDHEDRPAAWQAGELPVLVSPANTYDRIIRQWPDAPAFSHQIPKRLSVPEFIRRIAWRKFGALVAVALAVSLGARRIDCWGMDWAGQADFDGFTSIKQHRIPDRWAHEAELFGRLETALGPQGIQLARLGKGAA